jgi:hypothetical protein
VASGGKSGVQPAFSKGFSEKGLRKMISRKCEKDSKNKILVYSAPN